MDVSTCGGLRTSPGYERFEVVRHDDEIVAKYSPRSLCVKLRDDDLEAWAKHAVLRRRDKSGPNDVN
jgi:hypothetical protein